MQLCCFTILLAIVAGINAKPTNEASPKYPIILVPGDGGSQFEARLNKPKTVHLWCTQITKDWFPLWLNLELLAPYVLDCFVDNMKLQYNPKTRKTYNMPGVDTRQPGFGNSSTVEWLDSSHFSGTTYFYNLAQKLVNELGYTRNVDLRGAPYDFRKAPNEMEEFFENLKQLVENTYKATGNKRVVLVGHSMGNVNILYLLYQQTQQWKDKYVKSFISVSGPYGGAAKTLRLMASGDNLNVFVVNPLTARPQQRSMPSTAWLLPYESFWNNSEVMVYGPDFNYTVKDYKKFFTDINYMDGYRMRQDTEKLLQNLDPPGVDVHCLHGTDVKTPAQFKYTKSQWYDDQPDVVFGPGDGTVNLRSLHGCKRWVHKDGFHTVSHKEFTGAEHMAILKNKDVLEYIKSVLLE